VREDEIVDDDEAILKYIKEHFLKFQVQLLRVTRENHDLHVVDVKHLKGTAQLFAEESLEFADLLAMLVDGRTSLS